MAYNSIFTLATKGHLYEFTFVTNPKTGLTYIRPRTNESGKGIYTLLTQMVRTSFRNTQNGYSQLKPLLDFSFTVKGRRLTQYQAWLSVNEPKSHVYLTKEEARAGACVLEPWTISTGDRLSSIELHTVEGFEDRLVSNIRVDGLRITDETTVKEFASAVINSNEEVRSGIVLNVNELTTSETRFCQGDKLLFFRVNQVQENVPKVVARRHVVVLDTNCDMRLCDVAGRDGFSLVTHTVINGREGDYLSCAVREGSGVSYMQTRRDKDDRVLVSPQQLVIKSQLFHTYTSEEAMLKAIESYHGVNRVNYMRPDTNVEAWKNQLDDADEAPAGGGSTGGSGSTGGGSGSTGGGSQGGGSNGGDEFDM